MLLKIKNIRCFTDNKYEILVSGLVLCFLLLRIHYKKVA